MRAGIGTYAFRYALRGIKTDFSQFEKFARFCHTINAEAVQICDNVPLHLMNDKEVTDCIDLTRHYNLITELGTSGIEPEHLRLYIQLTTGFDSKMLRTIIQPDKNFQLSGIINKLEAIIPELEKNGVCLALENHFDLNPSQLLGIIEQIGHPLIKICIDPYNSIPQLCGPEETLQTLKAHIVSAHIKDIQVTRKGTGFSITGCQLGEGMLDLNHYLSVIFQSNPDCNIFLEHWMDEEPSQEETLNKEMRWVLAGMTILNKELSQIQYTSGCLEPKPAEI